MSNNFKVYYSDFHRLYYIYDNGRDTNSPLYSYHRISVGNYLYPDFSIRKDCKVGDSDSGYYETKKLAEKTLNEFLKNS